MIMILLFCATKGGEKLKKEENGQRAHQTEDEKRSMEQKSYV